MSRYIIDSTRIGNRRDRPNIFDVDLILDKSFRGATGIILRRLSLPVVWHTIQREWNNMFQAASMVVDNSTDETTTYQVNRYYIPEGWYDPDNSSDMENLAAIMTRLVRSKPPYLVDDPIITHNYFENDLHPGYNTGAVGPGESEINRDSVINRWRWDYTSGIDEYHRLYTMIGLVALDPLDSGDWIMPSSIVPNYYTMGWIELPNFHDVKDYWWWGVQGDADEDYFDNKFKDYHPFMIQCFTHVAIFIDINTEDADIDFMSVNSDALPPPLCVLPLPALARGENHTWDFDNVNQWAVTFADPTPLTQMRIKMLWYSPAHKEWVEYNPKFMQANWLLDFEILSPTITAYEHPLQQY